MSIRRIIHQTPKDDAPPVRLTAFRTEWRNLHPDWSHVLDRRHRAGVRRLPHTDHAGRCGAVPGRAPARSGGDESVRQFAAWEVADGAGRAAFYAQVPRETFAIHHWVGIWWREGAPTR